MNETILIDERLGITWYSEKESVNVESLTLPLLFHEIIINLGEIFLINESTEEQQILFSRIQPSIIKTKVKGKYQVAGILFSPKKIYQTFGLSLGEFTSQVINNPDYLLFDKKHEILEELDNVSFREKANTLANFFLKHSVNRKCPHLVDELLDFLTPVNFSNDIQIKKIAKEIDYTSKHLISQFKDVVGVTPKKFLQLNQINFASKLMWQERHKSLTSIALECGFYDQSHFIRTFKKITNLTPSYFKQKQMASGSFPPNTILR